jgi:YebC/PmpR family DNA-binding regulatory protein
MSGHSKWATIKHKKAVTDNKRGQVFTKLGRAIAIAAREGGPDINSNFKLRLAVEKARAENMPKINIERAISKGSGQGEGASLETGTYEGFGPHQVAIIVEVVTDNKNRSSAEIKNIFEKGGGHLGQPGSVGYLFSRKGRFLVAKAADTDSQILKIIDLGADDVEAKDEGVEVLVAPTQLDTMRSQLQQAGFSVNSAELIYKPTTLMSLSPEQEEKIAAFLESLEELDDVQAVFSNW